MYRTIIGEFVQRTRWNIFQNRRIWSILCGSVVTTLPCGKTRHTVGKPTATPNPVAQYNTPHKSTSSWRGQLTPLQALSAHTVSTSTDKLPRRPKFLLRYHTASYRERGGYRVHNKTIKQNTKTHTTFILVLLKTKTQRPTRTDAISRNHVEQ